MPTKELKFGFTQTVEKKVKNTKKPLLPSPAIKKQKNEKHIK